MSENPDQEAIIESLKSICNVMLHNETGLVGAPSVSLLRTMTLVLRIRALGVFVFACCGHGRQRQRNFS